MKGFTLIEIIVVVGIIGILLVASVPFYRTFQIQNGLAVALATYSQILDRAQLLSQSGQGDSGWGVLIATSSMTLYKGATYALRDTSYDEQYSFSTPFDVTGLKEINFARFTGLPSQTGTTTITTNGLPSRSISINAKGAATY